MAHRRRDPGGADQRTDRPAAEPPGVSLQPLRLVPGALHAGDPADDRAAAVLLSRIPATAGAREHMAGFRRERRNGCTHPVFHRLLPCDAGLLDPGNLDRHFHHLLLRVLPEWTGLSSRYHAGVDAELPEDLSLHL